MGKVVILDTLYSGYEEERSALRDLDTEVVTTKGENASALRELVADADGLLVNLNPVDAELVRGMTKCRIISRYGVGYDNVDVNAATDAGIWVSNVPDYATEDVSDHAVALLMACVRKIPLRDAGIRAGEWNLKERQRSRRTAGKTMGVLGLGNIGTATAVKLSGFGFARILACDPYIKEEAFAAAGAERVDFDTLLGESDFITIHTPLNDETRHLIGSRAFSLMKKSAILINTARGGVIDTVALVEALRSGEIEYAGLDVHEQEPLPEDSPLFALDNVVLSDHCAWYTEESLVELKTKAAQNVADVLSGNRPRSPVNDIR